MYITFFQVKFKCFALKPEVCCFVLRFLKLANLLSLNTKLIFKIPFWLPFVVFTNSWEQKSDFLVSAIVRSSLG